MTVDSKKPTGVSVSARYRISRNVVDRAIEMLKQFDEKGGEMNLPSDLAQPLAVLCYIADRLDAIESILRANREEDAARREAVSESMGHIQQQMNRTVGGFGGPPSGPKWPSKND